MTPKVAVPADQQFRQSKAMFDDQTAKSYMKALENVMITTKIYLQSGLSADQLSARTNIPKHHFSFLLDAHIGKTFYNYLSAYRVQEANYRIENDDNLTIDSHVHECGFYYKTSPYLKEGILKK